jgi:putative ABC transport system ATP-binding protein
VVEFAVRCQAVVKRFGEGAGEVVALRGVDLDIRAGEFMMLVGPSGCGKTTLISVIAGILASDEGSCEVLGERYEAMRSSQKMDFRAKNIGFVFQQFNLLPSLSIAENVAIPMIINGHDRSKAMQAARVMLEEVGLGDRANSKPNLLSGGQQQRVAIARALVHEPKILLCDEPTSALDHTTGMKILDMMRSLSARHGTTLIVVTHDSRIFKYADRIAHMDDGHIDKLSSAKEYMETAHA